MGDPIRLAWVEGDVAGMTAILSPDGGAPIGFIDYRQHRRGDLLRAVRIARFSDGSSDEDRVEARVGRTLRTLRGRSIIRNTRGIATVELEIDVVVAAAETARSRHGAPAPGADERQPLR